MMANKECIRKWICIPAYIIVALCALYCSYSYLELPGHKVINMDLLYFRSDNKTVKTTVNIILLIASLVTLGCAIGWMVRK
jgi:hypothetical protein